MKQTVIYIHGKGGNASEAEHYEPLFPDCDVIGFDYRAETPWEAKREFPVLFDRLSGGYESVTLVANSIGAYFAMTALAKQADRRIGKAYFVSPVVDMEKLIADRMTWAGVTEAELREKRVIETTFGEPLSWEYLCHVRENPINWKIPTRILCGGRDALTSLETMTAFAGKIGAKLTVMPEGEHWFHTEEQMRFLDDWIRKEQKTEIHGGKA